jgi:tetratricopeptide (TPR) repeat protein
MGYVPPHVAIPRAKEAAAKAFELDATLALAHYALAVVAWNEWDWQTNEAEFRRTIELDPNFPDVRAFYSHLLIALKRPDEALAQIEQALRLDPFNPFIQALYGMDLYFVRRYDQAIVQFQSALRTSPGLPVARCGLLHAYNMTGRSDRALEAAQGCFEQYGPQVKGVLARGYATAGYREAMRRLGDFFAAGLNGTYVAPNEIFLAYAHAGEADLALQWLSKSVDARDPNVYGAVRDPFVVGRLGDDPRFQKIVRRTGLPN